MAGALVGLDVEHIDFNHQGVTLQMVAADRTPWRVLAAVAADWSQLRFETRPLYEQAA